MTSDSTPATHPDPVAAAPAAPSAGRPAPAKPGAARIREINDTIRYAMWSVFAVAEPLGDADRDKLAGEVESLLGDLAEAGVVTRGLYDVAGLRADADLMVWWHAETVEQVQDAYHRFLRTELGAHLDPVWSVVALHRPAEFNKSHIPAFMADEEARGYVCVYPFVRSYDWYVMDDTERRDMLVEHGQMARGYPDVRANTIAAFALGDYEWVLAFEADELHRIVDLMRDLRASKARLHVREEVPFYTGPRVEVGDLVARQR
jgi:chlorite dismutase